MENIIKCTLLDVNRSYGSLQVYLCFCNCGFWLLVILMCVCVCVEGGLIIGQLTTHTPRVKTDRIDSVIQSGHGSFDKKGFAKYRLATLNHSLCFGFTIKAFIIWVCTQLKRSDMNSWSAGEESAELPENAVGSFR